VGGVSRRRRTHHQVSYLGRTWMGWNQSNDGCSQISEVLINLTICLSIVILIAGALDFGKHSVRTKDAGQFASFWSLKKAF
jgi:hypothetical protein